MAIILDTDVIIRSEKGAFDLKGWIYSRPDDHFEIAAITIAELWHGVERATGPHRRRRESFLQAIVEALPVISYTEATAYEHARIWAALTVTGTMISYCDVIVAATALERGCQVATFNRRHFHSVKGLSVIEPA